MSTGSKKARGARRGALWLGGIAILMTVPYLLLGAGEGDALVTVDELGPAPGGSAGIQR